MAQARRAARRLSPDVVQKLWSTLGQLFGRRRPHLVVHPLLGGLLAITETVTLLAIIRLLLLLEDGAATIHLEVLSADVTLSFGGLATVALAGVLATLALRLVEGYFAARNQTRAIQEARRMVIEAYFEADWEQLHGEGARLGRLQQLVGANAQRAAIPVQLLSVGSVAAISLVVYVAIVLVTAPTIALLFAVIGIASAALLNPLRRRTKRQAVAHTVLVGDMQLASTSYAHLNRELHVFGVQHAAATALTAMSESAARAFERLKLLQRLIPSIYQQILLTAVVAVVVIGRELDVAAVQFGTAAILAVRSLSYIQQLNSSLQVFVENQPFLDELFDAVHSDKQRRRRRGDQILGPVRSIRLVGVGYDYATGTRALDGIDLELRAGDWLGVVGPSGGGKSTLANVIAGLLTPTRGQLEVNGQDSAVCTAPSWAAQFALLSQEPVLLPASVRDNIDFHRGFEDESIRRAAELAGIAREVEALPEGYDSVVGEGGSSLSGGQRQRVALARCLVGGPSCLILDEPTSALDAVNEALVERSLLEIPRDDIVIVVSHRRALLGRCNRFVALEQGRVVRYGSAEDVDLEARMNAS